ncbi:MAG: hypothetical protein IAE91_00095, partial [Ignavibacteriaceae bacterium]|nr:hypothetical protein [Ignavibacteriaceae bacterium]
MCIRDRNTYSAIEYDESGRISAVSISEDGGTFIEHSYYDANDRVEAKTGGNMFGLYRSEFEYDNFGNVTKNTHSVWEYDENGEPDMFGKCYIFLYLYE